MPCDSSNIGSTALSYGCLIPSSDNRARVCVFTTAFLASSAIFGLIKYLMNKEIYERKVTGNIKKVKMKYKFLQEKYS